MLKNGGYRYYSVSADRGEPPPVHVQRDSGLAKLWLRPVALSTNGNFSQTELRLIQRTVERHQDSFLEAWDEFFAD